MAKVRVQTIKPEQRERLTRRLARAVAALRGPAEVEDFLRSFLTPSEIVMLGRRLQIAEALLRGETYLEIRRRFGVGLTTVQYMDRWLRGRVKRYVYGDARKRHRAGVRRRLHAVRRLREARAWRKLRLPGPPSIWGIGRPYFEDEEEGK